MSSSLDSKSLILVGAGGHGKVIADSAEGNECSSIVFLDRTYTPGESKLLLDRYPVIDLDDNFHNYLSLGRFIIAIGDNSNRQREYEKFEVSGAKFARLVHSFSNIAQKVFFGNGTVVLANAVVNADVIIGVNTIINTGAIVEHDCIVGSHCHIAPGVVLAGGVVVGDGTLIGIGARVLPYVKIGVNVTVGAGAVVIGDIPDNAIVAGVPARPVKSSKGADLNA